MSKKQKLELTWVGKNEGPKLESRILIEDLGHSYRSSIGSERKEKFENKLIYGDNLLALKALETEYTGKIKCIYIDPPFNTGGAFQHYDDNLEHSIWLSLMRDRLIILQKLLSDDGAIVVNLDDTEFAYCKVLMDEIFGRKNYILTIVVEAATPSSFKTVNTGPTEITQYLLFFAKDKSKFKYIPQYIPIYDIDLQHFSRFILNPELPPDQWKFKSINEHILQEMGCSGATTNAMWSAAKKHLGTEEAQLIVKQRASEFALKNCERVFETKTLQKPSKWLHEYINDSLKSDKVICLPREGMDSLYLYRGRQIYFLGKGVKVIDGETVVTQPLPNIWTDIPTNNLQREGGIDFPSGKKPEFLISRILRMVSSSHDDIILDSFGGSGTTGAVAHKMGRRWIMIELGEHCHTHIIPRLKKVIDGQDPGGITEAVGWKGGGGFRYFRLAPSLLEKDAWDNLVISKEYNPAMLAEAVCRHMGFTYEPSAEHYWMHGKSSETDFIYVTTAALTSLQLRALSEEVGESRTLLICCKAFTGSADQHANLTLKKIPNAVLRKCEWGRDDYSLNVSNPPEAENSAGDDSGISAGEPKSAVAPKRPATRSRPAKVAAGSPNLFDADSAA